MLFSSTLIYRFSAEHNKPICNVSRRAYQKIKPSV